jgi:hypothetical protein
MVFVERCDVFPVRYGLNFYTEFRRNLVFKGVKLAYKGISRQLKV